MISLPNSSLVLTSLDWSASASRRKACSKVKTCQKEESCSVITRQARLCTPRIIARADKLSPFRSLPASLPTINASMMGQVRRVILFSEHQAQLTSQRHASFGFEHTFLLEAAAWLPIALWPLQQDRLSFHLASRTIISYRRPKNHDFGIQDF